MAATEGPIPSRKNQPFTYEDGSKVTTSSNKGHQELLWHVSQGHALPRQHLSNNDHCGGTAWPLLPKGLFQWVLSALMLPVRAVSQSELSQPNPACPLASHRGHTNIPLSKLSLSNLAFSLFLFIDNILASPIKALHS